MLTTWILMKYLNHRKNTLSRSWSFLRETAEKNGLLRKSFLSELSRKLSKLLVLENFIFLMFNQILFLKLPNFFPVFNLGPREIYFIEELLLDEHSSFFKPTIQKDTILVSILFLNLNVHDAFLIVLNIGTICKKFSLLIQRILGYHWR